MKKLISFISYHNAVPFALGVLFLGGASAFAASATGVIDIPLPFVGTPQEVDASPLLAADVDAFDFRPTVIGVQETDTHYTVSYSLQTLSPQDGAWVAFEKTGEFSVAKATLDDTGLQGYVVQKLRDIENGERVYLSRAQTTEKKLADARTAKPANAFAALIGLALDQIPVPIVAKPAPEPQVETLPAREVAKKEGEVSAAPAASSAPETATTTVPIADAASSTPPTTDIADAATSTPADAESLENEESATLSDSQQTSEADTTSETATASTTPSDMPSN